MIGNENGIQANQTEGVVQFDAFQDVDDPVLVQIVRNARFFLKKSINLDTDTKLKNIMELNKNLKTIEHEKRLVEMIQKDELIIVIRDLLLDREMNIRKEAVKCLRRLINKNPKMIARYKEFKIQFLLSRNIEKDSKMRSNSSKSLEVFECKC
jgi:hypothetical protein